MKLQSTLFVLFLFVFTFLSTHSWAQTYSIQPKNELEATQDAQWLAEEMQRNQPVISETQKRENRSTDAMHWTAVGVNQQSQFLTAISKQLPDGQKGTPSGLSIYKQVNKPITTMKKPANRSL